MTSVIDRRTFLAGAGVVLIVAPLAAEAQPTVKVYTIGWLTLSASPVSITFRKALQSLGWIEGKNVVILYKTAEFRSERLPEIVAEFVDLKVDVIVADSAEAA